ncbi:MAG: hypothetical protein ACXAEN_25690 [Candidatus Thorarchaeota archaeon]|jgi:hypothetical protein
MGELDPETKSVSGVSPQQGLAQNLTIESLQQLLGGGAGGLFGARGGALGDILGGAPTDITGIENAMLRRYSEQIEPQIEVGAAGLGGSLSSRVAETKRQALGDVQSQIGAFQTQLMESARNRQLQAAQQVLGPLQIAAGFGTQRTQDTMAFPSATSQGFNMGMELLGASSGK